MLKEKARQMIEQLIAESAKAADEVCEYAFQNHKPVPVSNNFFIEQLHMIQHKNQQARENIKGKKSNG